MLNHPARMNDEFEACPIPKHRELKLRRWLATRSRCGCIPPVRRSGVRCNDDPAAAVVQRHGRLFANRRTDVARHIWQRESPAAGLGEHCHRLVDRCPADPQGGDPANATVNLASDAAALDPADGGLAAGQKAAVVGHDGAQDEAGASHRGGIVELRAPAALAAARSISVTPSPVSRTNQNGVPLTVARKKIVLRAHSNGIVTSRLARAGVGARAGPASGAAASSRTACHPNVAI